MKIFHWKLAFFALQEVTIKAGHRKRRRNLKPDIAEGELLDILAKEFAMVCDAQMHFANWPNVYSHGYFPDRPYLNYLGSVIWDNVQRLLAADLDKEDLAISGRSLIINCEGNFLDKISAWPAKFEAARQLRDQINDLVYNSRFDRYHLGGGEWKVENFNMQAESLEDFISSFDPMPNKPKITPRKPKVDSADKEESIVQTKLNEVVAELLKRKAVTNA